MARRLTRASASERSQRLAATATVPCRKRMADVRRFVRRRNMLRGGGRRLARGRAGRRQWIILGRIRGYLTLTGRNTRSCKNKRIQIWLVGLARARAQRCCPTGIWWQDYKRARLAWLLMTVRLGAWLGFRGFRRWRGCFGRLRFCGIRLGWRVRAFGGRRRRFL